MRRIDWIISCRIGPCSPVAAYRTSRAFDGTVAPPGGGFTFSPRRHMRQPAARMCPRSPEQEARVTAPSPGCMFAAPPMPGQSRRQGRPSADCTPQPLSKPWPFIRTDSRVARFVRQHRRALRRCLSTLWRLDRLPCCRTRIWFSEPLPRDECRASPFRSDPLPPDRLAALTGPFSGKNRCKGCLRMGNFRGRSQPRPNCRPSRKDRLDLLLQRCRTHATH